jgi:hypothetical protein
MLVSYGDLLEGRDFLTQLVLDKKNQSNFNVIDVGGAATGWTNQIADVFVDINRQDNNKLQFNFDICREKNWDPILDYVEKNGKFDFSICTHTLEDIYNPYLVLDMLPKISKQGYISTPSVLSEINNVESKNWIGYIHHRYLFGYKDNIIIIAPKLPVLEKLVNKKKPNTIHEEIRFMWEDTLHYKIFMDNYLGPNPATVLRNFEAFILEQI